MRELLQTWISVALLRGIPSDHPGDQQSLIAAVLAAMVSSILVLSVELEFASAIKLSVLDLLFTGAVLMTALQLVGKSARFTQAFATYGGAGAVMNVVVLLMLMVLPRAASRTDELSLVDFFYFLQLVWAISIVARIVRYTFDISLPVSVLAATGYLMVTITVVGMIHSGA